MKREVVRTADGSVTIHIPQWNESYHSKFGAIQEAYHVFIRAGLDLFKGKPVRILEMGFGTGLNCFITFLESCGTGQIVDYTGIEAFPVTSEEMRALNYPEILGVAEHRHIFDRMHDSLWSETIELCAGFDLTKRRILFQEVGDQNAYDLIYFDAFGFQVQPELWDAAMFERMYHALVQGGALVTYAARGVVRRNMIAAGFKVEKLAGPQGKREMLRAIKP